MNIQLGIYELFSTIIPGCVYLVSITEILIMSGILKLEKLDIAVIADLSFILAIILLLTAYLLGIVLSPFGLFWYKRFKRKDQSSASLKEFKLRHQGRWNIEFEDVDWHILLAFVRSKNLDLARENERHLAGSIMLRNISFGFFLLAIINFVQSRLAWNFFFLLAGIVLLILSWITISESKKFRRWYYDSILSSVLAYRVDLEKSIKQYEAPTKTRKGRNG